MKEEPEFSTVKREKLKRLIEKETTPEKFTLDNSQNAVSNNSNLRMNNIQIGEDEILKVWLAQVSPSVGEGYGALLQIKDNDTGEILLEVGSGSTDGVVSGPDEPIMEYEGTGSFLLFRLRNETGSSTNLSGFVTLSVEEIPE